MESLKMFIGVNMIALAGGFLLDLLFGDPYWLPHPIRLIGRWIACLERLLRGRKREPQDPGEQGERQGHGKQSAWPVCHELLMGSMLVLLVLIPVAAVVSGILILADRLHPYAGLAVRTIMAYQILAAKCLKQESMKVYERLAAEDLPGARRAVSMIVGRDTQQLDEAGITRAAVETVAENTSDGVIAPMLYLAFGGPAAGFLYKAVNTMDSMVGYKNERYLYFGRAAAKLDDLVNYIPARLSAFLMIAAAYLAGKEFDGARAMKIYRRDNRKHASPNSAQTEAVCAGALGIRLAGDTSYFGKVVRKPFIGDARRQTEAEDIPRANRLMYGTAWLCEVLCLLGMYLVWIRL